MTETAQAPFELAPGRSGPAIIAHGGGNSAALAGDFLAQHPLLPRLGKFRMGKGCLYIRRLSDVDLPTLRLLLSSSIRHGQG